MGNTASRYRSMIAQIKERNKMHRDMIDMAEYFDDEELAACVNDEGNKMSIWVEVHGQPEMVGLIKSLSDLNPPFGYEFRWSIKIHI